METTLHALTLLVTGHFMYSSGSLAAGEGWSLERLLQEGLVETLPKANSVFEAAEGQ